MQVDPDLLLISQVSPLATEKLAVFVTGAPPAPAMTDAEVTFFQYCSVLSYWIRSPLANAPNCTLLSVPPSTEPGTMRMCIDPEPPDAALITSPMYDFWFGADGLFFVMLPTNAGL